MWKTVLLIENDHHELNLMRHAIGEVDSTLHCMSFVYADEVVPALTNEMKHVTDLLAELCPMKAMHHCKIAVFAPVMPKRVAYAYRVMGANYAFQKPVTREGYGEIFSRILGKENYVTLSTPNQ